MMFNQNDGLWDLNFALNYVNGFIEEMSFEEAYRLIYRFLFTLVERTEGRSKDLKYLFHRISSYMLYHSTL
ncbi:hypothetical protein [Ferdinandcohnia sp. Marseille-Q9671]